MKKYVILVLILFFNSIMMNAQKEVTKFLGIPVDGLKPAMIQKLKAKGFHYNQSGDYLTGEFNGYEVNLSVVTNNNKVWRIVIHDDISVNEADIKIRFNKLCNQFEKNKKYVSAVFKDQKISESENISYETTVNNKRYEAVFYQRPAIIDTLAIQDEIRSILLEKYSEEQLENPTEEEQSDIKYIATMHLFDIYSKSPVWFMIKEEYGRYRIVMFYDNEYNHSDGEDL